MVVDGGLIPENGEYDGVGATITATGAETDSTGSDARDDADLESRLNPWLDRYNLRREDVIMLAALLQASSVVVAMYIEVNS